MRAPMCSGPESRPHPSQGNMLTAVFSNVEVMTPQILTWSPMLGNRPTGTTSAARLDKTGTKQGDVEKERLGGDYLLRTGRKHNFSSGLSSVISMPAIAMNLQLSISRDSSSSGSLAMTRQYWQS